ncbi:deoxyribose-phosphate aldolase [Desulfotomaculum sp. 1211_IL3151]|uniref:deoxyribose-phosphate aldolase n=1 Tax=Desulfotomaculum sp. 1211_IL3151 TaxID=3084055 RepID=UPI002FDB8DEB
MDNIAKTIDHTLLKPDATKQQIEKLAREAQAYGFAAVCVNPVWVETAYNILKTTPEVKVATVIGFPLGATLPEVKALETQKAIEHGATEVDMVIHMGALKERQDQLVERDIRAVVEAARGKALVKVIIETSLLTEEEKMRACHLAVAAGADFVKTSTGFSGGGATVQDVALMRQKVGPTIGIKASGGIRTREDAQRMLEAGATRIGTSAGVAMLG